MFLDGDEPQANLRENALKVGAGFYVVTAKTAEIADYEAFNPAALDVGHQAVKLRPVENRPRPSVIHIDIDEIEIRATGNIGLTYLNLIGDDIHFFRFAAVLHGKTGINGCREDLQRCCFANRLCGCNFSAFSCHALIPPLSGKQKLKQTIDRCIITAKDYDEFLKLMQEAGYEIKTGKYISFRAEGQERFTRAKTIGDNYTEERIKERIQGRGNRKRQMQTSRRGISLISDIQERIQLIGSKGYEHKAKLTILKEAARTLNYLTENNLLQYADLEKKVEDIHSSYARTGSELKNVEAKLREVQPLIKNISNYQRLKPVYDVYMKAADKPAYRAKHEAELVIYEAAKSTLLAIQGDGKLPSLKSLQAEQQRLADEQQRLYDERAKLKKEARLIDTMKANVDDFLSPSMAKEQEKSRSGELE